jgi:hypothetical protein
MVSIRSRRGGSLTAIPSSFTAHLSFDYFDYQGDRTEARGGFQSTSQSRTVGPLYVIIPIMTQYDAYGKQIAPFARRNAYDAEIREFRYKSSEPPTARPTATAPRPSSPATTSADSSAKETDAGDVAAYAWATQPGRRRDLGDLIRRPRPRQRHDDFHEVIQPSCLSTCLSRMRHGVGPQSRPSPTWNSARNSRSCQVAAGWRWSRAGFESGMAADSQTFSGSTTSRG